jgi:hypothetical protein
MAMLGKGTAIEVGRGLVRIEMAVVILFSVQASRTALAETIDAEAALKAMASYSIGQDPQTASEIEELVRAVNSRTDAEGAAARSELAAKIAHTLASNATPAAKEFLCRQILTLAGEKQVPVLASLLLATPGTAEARVADAARGALEAIPGPAPDAALLDALAKTEGSVKVGIIESLGNRRCRGAVGALSPLLSDYYSASALASAAAAALAKIGGAEAEEAVNFAVTTGLGEVMWVRVEDIYLKYADRYREAGKLAEATAIYTPRYIPTLPLPIQETALIGLVLSDPKGIAMALAALSSSEPAMQRTALTLVRELPGSTGTTVITGQLGKVSPSMDAYLLDALADRGDRSALAAVERAMQSQDESVRVAAVRALGVLGSDPQVKLLAETSVSGSNAVREAARHSLDRLRGASVDETMRKLMSGADPQMKAELARSLKAREATGPRPGVGQSAAVLKPEELVQRRPQVAQSLAV